MHASYEASFQHTMTTKIYLVVAPASLRPLSQREIYQNVGFYDAPKILTTPRSTDRVTTHKSVPAAATAETLVAG